MWMKVHASSSEESASGTPLLRSHVPQRLHSTFAERFTSATLAVS